MRVATPTDPSLAYLEARGLIVPESEILKDSEASVPLDFTAISNVAIGRQHSHWAVRHAHALVELAKIAEEQIRLRRAIEFEETKFRYRNKGQYKTKYAADDAMVMEIPRYKKMIDKMTELEAMHVMVEAVVNSYEGLRNAASREIARRSAEVAPRD